MRCSVSGLALAVILLTLSSTAGADQAQPSIKLGGRMLQLASTQDSRMEAKVDDQVVAEGAYLEVEASFNQDSASGGPRGAAVMLASDGGNGCPGNYVVVSVDKDGTAAATDPFGTCSDTAETSAADGVITVRFPPVAGHDGTVYRWSFAAGLEPPVTEAFQPKPGTGWADAPELVGRYPWEALDNADVYAAFQALLGDDFKTFTDYFGKADQMTATSDGIIVGDCFDDSGEESSDLLIGIDPANHKVYAVMQDGNEAPRFYPPKDQWPASLQAKLQDWPG